MFVSGPAHVASSLSAWRCSLCRGFCGGADLRPPRGRSCDGGRGGHADRQPGPVCRFIYGRPHTCVLVSDGAEWRDTSTPQRPLAGRMRDDPRGGTVFRATSGCSLPILSLSLPANHRGATESFTPVPSDLMAAVNASCATWPERGTAQVYAQLLSCAAVIGSGDVSVRHGCAVRLCISSPARGKSRCGISAFDQRHKRNGSLYTVTPSPGITDASSPQSTPAQCLLTPRLAEDILGLGRVNEGKEGCR